MIGTLRETIKYLTAENMLLMVEREVDPVYELNAVLQKIQATRNLPVVFQNVKRTPYPVLTNLYGSHDMAARMLNASTVDVAEHWYRMFTRHPVDPTDTFPECNIDYVTVQLSDLPHIVFSEKDAGPYITAGVIVSRDPLTNVLNLSYHRMQIASATELRVRLSTSGDLFRMQQHAESTGIPLPILITIGLPPDVMLAAATTVSPEYSEYDLAAQIAGKYHRMRRFHNDLPAPDSTEFVIEGEILPNERHEEGPFGEWMGFYTQKTLNHVISVKCVHARNDAIFYAIGAGSCEELTLTGIPIAGLIYRAIRTWVPNVVDVACFPLLQFCVIKLRDPKAGDANRALVAAFGAEMNRLKFGIVVDVDVNIHDYHDVLWAVATRCRPDEDTFTIPSGPSFSRDPYERHWGRLGIIAVKTPSARASQERKRVPGLDAIDLSSYLTP